MKLLLTAAASVAVASATNPLMDALDAALIRLVSDGEYFNTLAPVGINIFPADCYPFTESYPYPARGNNINGYEAAQSTVTDAWCEANCDNFGAIHPACGTFTGAACVPYYNPLEDVLQNGLLKIALPIGASPYANTPPPFGPVAAIAPSGPAVDLWEHAVGAISAEYGVPLTIQYQKKFGNDATFTAVDVGEAHLVAPFAAVGGLVDVGDGDIRRKTNFKASCAWFSSELFLVVKDDATVTSLQSVRDTGSVICAYVQFSGISKALFDSPNLISAGPPSFKTPQDAEAECLGDVSSGAAVAYLTDTLPVNLAGYTAISTKITPSTAFWGQDL